ncbi:Fe-S metabolism associated domain protein [Arthrobacter saudimassiliensis]|uniref:Fe-S metabolism associated domain protein n=1 Tax=Arthrobacter saudimassiliensis TaxID=1461584 RepID=A0A078MRB3_9MICC|nr:Fe-S metabolism associated domain protein [Arthrobacter saudimassiliensis]
MTGTDTSGSTLPAQLADIIEDFQAMSEQERLELLLEFSRSLPDPPAAVADRPELMEQVVECQSPVFLSLDVADDPEQTVQLYFSAPPEAPTTRGFAGVLHEGLNGLPAAQILAVPADVPDRLGLTRAITPLRMRGMAAMLGRIKRRLAQDPRVAAEG